MKNQLAMSDMY